MWGIVAVANNRGWAGSRDSDRGYVGLIVTAKTRWFHKSSQNRDRTHATADTAALCQAQYAYGLA